MIFVSHQIEIKKFESEKKSVKIHSDRLIKMWQCAGIRSLCAFGCNCLAIYVKKKWTTIFSSITAEAENHGIRWTSDENRKRDANKWARCLTGIFFTLPIEKVGTKWTYKLLYSLCLPCVGLKGHFNVDVYRCSKHHAIEIYNSFSCHRFIESDTQYRWFCFVAFGQGAWQRTTEWKEKKSIVFQINSCW